jgi:formyl-CoA transferase
MILKQRTRDGHEVEVPGIVPKLSGTPGAIRRPAPALGEDTDAVLAELGYSADEIAALRKASVI